MSLINDELYELLEEAAKNATGRDDIDVAEYVMLLEEEWITDIEALEKMDSAALDEMLPRLLSRELQRLMRRGYRRTTVDRNRRWKRSCAPGPPKPKLFGSKPANFQEDHPKPSIPPPPHKDNGMSAPPDVVPIGEDDSLSSASAGKDEQGCNLPGCSVTCNCNIKPKQSTPSTIKGKDKDAKSTAECSIKTELVSNCKDGRESQKIKSDFSIPALKVLPRIEEEVGEQSRNNRPKKAGPVSSYPILCKIYDFFDTFCHVSFPQENLAVDEEGIESNELKEISSPNPIFNHLVGDDSRRENIIIQTHKRFPTREALEDAISEYQAVVELEQKEAAARATFRVKERLTSPAEDELRALYPLRLILPTIGDLSEMIVILQDQREQAMRDLNMELANNCQREMDDLQAQVDKEERYLMKKQLQEVECVACGEKFAHMSRERKKLLCSGIRDGPDAIAFANKKKLHCEKCRDIFGIEEDEDGEQGSILRRILTAATEDADKGDVSQYSVDDEGEISRMSFRSPDSRYGYASQCSDGDQGEVSGVSLRSPDTRYYYS